METRRVIIGFLAALIFLFGFFWCIFPILIVYTAPPYVYLNTNEPVNVLALNKNISEKYNTLIYPSGKKIISDELEKINQLPTDEAKLDEIFRWEMNDWHNPLWEPQNFYYYQGDDTFAFYNMSYDRFKVNPNAQNKFLILQRNPYFIPYGDDPYTIAFTKVGSCKELSNMFSYMAKKSGFESRTLFTLWDHQWAEVKINGEWYYYDPWCAVEHGYYNPNDGNLTFKDKWFNRPEYFRDNCHDKAYLNKYNEFPWDVATIDYTLAYGFHDLYNKNQSAV